MIEAVIVDALVIGNDTVSVIDIVNAEKGCLGCSACTVCFADPRLIVDGVDQVHDVVPDHERGHDHGVEHEHEQRSRLQVVVCATAS